MSEKNEMYQYVEEVAERNGYYLCPGEDLLDDLVEGLVENERRYGYKSCPCRPASGIKKYDVDILCPCEYCDADVNEHGMCYCGLFVSEEVNKDPSKLGPVPERRPKEVIDQALEKGEQEEEVQEEAGSAPGIQEDVEEGESEKQVWRCSVCGYLCAREMPPPVCPICKAKSERFSEFSFT